MPVRSCASSLSSTLAIGLHGKTHLFGFLGYPYDFLRVGRLHRSDGGTAAAVFPLFEISKRPSRLDVGRGSSSAGHRRQCEVAGAAEDLYVVASCGVLVAGTLQPHVAAHGAEGLIVEG